MEKKLCGHGMTFSLNPIFNCPSEWSDEDWIYHLYILTNCSIGVLTVELMSLNRIIRFVIIIAIQLHDGWISNSSIAGI